MACIINADNGAISGSAGVKTTADSTGVLNIQTNGTTAISISASQAVSFTNTPTFTGGTANGVLYLNGSKAATSGSAFTFSGTAFSVGDGSTQSVQNINGGATGGAIKGQRSGVNHWFLGDTSAALGSGSGLINFLYGADPFIWYASSAELMRLTTTGLGIGTSSPTAKLDVNGEVRIYPSSSPAQLRFGVSATEKGKLSVDTSSNMAFETAGSERMRLDSSGNLGLGVTPSAWGSGLKALQVGANSYASLFDFDNGVTSLSSNLFWNGSAYSRISASSRWSFAYFQDTTNGAHSWVTSTAAGTSTPTMSTLMTLNASGNLGIGTTTIGSRVTIGDPGTGLSFTNATATSGFNIGLLAGTGSAQAYVFSRDNAALLFGTNNTERARITSGGNLFVGCTAVPSASVQGFCITGTSSGNLSSSGTSTAAYNHFLFLNGNGTVGSISTSGSTTTYSTSSDRRLKSNIVPAPSASDDIDAIQIVSHDWKAVPNEHVKYGVIAQDLHSVAPEAVFAGDDGEELEKAWGVDYSKLVPMLVKEIQSLRARVAQLETK